MAGRPPPNLNITSGRRGYYRWLYGKHYWIPEVQADWSKGIIRDSARDAIPVGGLYDSADYLFHQPGVAQKRGGTAYPWTALTGAAYVVGLKHVPFAGGAQLVAIGSNGHLFKLAAAGGSSVDVGAIGGTEYGQMAISPGAKYLMLPQNTPGTQWQKYDGTTISSLDSTGAAMHSATYKSRLIASGGSIPNRIFFSPTPDVNATWDILNSWIDADNPVSGLAALNAALLIFSTDGMERIIGATPPPNTDMDRAPVSPIGCTDHRSIVQVGPNVFFANPEGVYLTNGSTPVNLTEQGGIATYWRSLFTTGSAYISAAPIPSAATFTIAAGWYRGFLFVSVLDASRVLRGTLMCNVAKRAWWPLTNIKASCYATSVDGTELYYGDATTNQVVAMSGIFNPQAANKNDADGTAVLPVIEFAPFGQGTGVKSFGFAHLNYDMRDAAADNPQMSLNVKTGTEAENATQYIPAENPLSKTTTMVRSRFSVNRSAQAVTVRLSQSSPSSKTEVYALEVMSRSQPLTGEGVS